MGLNIFNFDSDPLVSNPVPIPNILDSITNLTDFIKSIGELDLVLTKAQLFNAGYSFFYSVIGLPIAHNPLPGGKNFISYILLYIFYACS